MAEEEKPSKLNSRKFMVWVVWGIIALSSLAIGLIYLIVTKSFPETVSGLITLCLGYFFYISLAYIGVNGLQKVGFAVSDALSSKDEK